MKAISPVIATVIIVAVAIAISIAVALWITGLTSSFTGVEKLEVVNAYAEAATAKGTYDNDHTYWIVHIVVKNTGTKTATIDQIFINNKPGTITVASYINTSTTPAETSNIPNTGLSIKPGEQYEIVFNLTSTTDTLTVTTPQSYTITPGVSDTFTSGQTVSIVIHTASGGQYPATITLP
ncbi:MAG: DUF4352 domain-containing protein [Staphylothermus sp.]|nr:DUF4352 domain-containing protein [Staphylothermus sp.]